MKTALLASALAIAASIGTTANAAPVLSSAASAATVNISAAGIIQAGLSLGNAAGTAPPAYDNTGNLLSINEGAVLVSPSILNGLVGVALSLTSGVVNSRANSGATSATGTTSIVDLDASLISTALSIPLISFGISADAVTSTTTAGYTGSGVYSSGSSSITGLSVDTGLLGLPLIDGSLYANAAPNTVLLNLLGISVILNEQSTVTTASSVSMFTNALRISLNDFLLGGQLLSGDIVLGHSEASVTGFAPVVTPVPEPGTWALLVTGFGLIGGMMRAHRRKTALVPA